MTTFALNGLGRMGKLALRPLLQAGAQIAWINDAVGDPAMHAHLLEFDSVHGRWPATFAHDADSVTIDGARLPFIGTKSLADLPLQGVDVVIDCTGVFKNAAKLQPYFDAGVKKVVVSAPVKDGPTANIVMGVNDQTYDPARHRIVTAASCTTNCLAPVAKVLQDSFGIQRGLMTTVHAYTNDQRVQDMPHSDLYRARSAAQNIIPTSTGAAKAVGLVIPSLQGKLTGIAMRVPVPTGSVVDLTVDLDKKTTAAEINAAIKAAAEGPLKGVLYYTEDPIVSTDIIGDPHSSIFAAPFTQVMQDDMVKVVSWYDNEAGYSARTADLAAKFGAM